MGWEWLVVMIVMAIFGLLSQWLENMKREQAKRPPRRRVPQPVDQPENIDDLLRDILAREAPPKRRPPTEPPVGRPVPRQRPAPPRAEPVRKPRPQSVPPVRQTGALDEVKEAVSIDADKLLVGFREAQQRDLSAAFDVGQDLAQVAPTARAPLSSPLANEVREQLLQGDLNRLAQAIVLYELLRPPVSARRHVLPMLAPLPTPWLPPPAESENWL